MNVDISSLIQTKSTNNNNKNSKQNGGVQDLRTLKLDRGHGSTAGAGSGDFHTYRKHRRTEMSRIANLEEEARKEKESMEFKAKHEAWDADAKAKTAKRRQQRLKKKERQKAKRKAEKAEKVLGFKNDGSFMEEFKKRKVEQQDSPRSPQPPSKNSDEQRATPKIDDDSATKDSSPRAS